MDEADETGRSSLNKDKNQKVRVNTRREADISENCQDCSLDHLNSIAFRILTLPVGPVIVLAIERSCSSRFNMESLRISL